jgi:hypothetical protein
MTNDRTRPSAPAPLSAKAAFVVHLTATAADAPETLLGRVEHVRSGKSLRFASAGELVGFMQRTLATHVRNSKENR